jgi:chromosome segregation ATPase
VVLGKNKKKIAKIKKGDKEKREEGKKEEIETQVQEIQQAQEVKQAPETVEKRETIEDMKERVYSDVLEIERKIYDVKRCIDSIEKKINEVNSVYQEVAKKIESYKKDIKELEESLFPSIQKEIDAYRERIKGFDYEKGDLIDAYKLGRELGYSREQLKNIAAAITLKKSMQQRGSYKIYWKDPKEIRMYIVETAVKARKELKERLYEEIYK